MKKRAFITAEEFLKTNSVIVDGTKLFNFNGKTKAYWPLGTWKDGKIWSNAISMTLEPDKQFIQI